MWLTTPDSLRLIFHNLSVVFLYSTVVLGLATVGLVMSC